MIGNIITAIITAIITGGLALLGVVLSNNATADKTQANISTAQAVTDTKLDELTCEVREHNNFARRMPTCGNRACTGGMR